MGLVVEGVRLHHSRCLLHQLVPALLGRDAFGRYDGVDLVTVVERVCVVKRFLALHRDRVLLERYRVMLVVEKLVCVRLLRRDARQLHRVVQIRMLQHAVMIGVGLVALGAELFTAQLLSLLGVEGWAAWNADFVVFVFACREEHLQIVLLLVRRLSDEVVDLRVGNAARRAVQTAGAGDDVARVFERAAHLRLRDEVVRRLGRAQNVALLQVLPAVRPTRIIDVVGLAHRIFFVLFIDGVLDLGGAGRLLGPVLRRDEPFANHLRRVFHAV